MVDKRVIDTIIAEAVGDGEEGMLAVAFAIANRARKSGKTLYEVVSAPKQFEGFSDPGPGVRSAINNPKIRAQVEQLLDAAVNRTVPDPLKGGTMFHAKSMTPYWASAENKYGTTRIGNQVFYLGNQKPEPVSPEVPPPPNRAPAGTAIAALDRLLGNSDPTATAYAPDMGSLTASPMAQAAPPVPVQRQAAPVTARSAALPAGAPVQALPGVPPRSAPAMGASAALPPPMPRNAVTPPTPLNAPSPIIPTLRANSPWAPWEEMGMARTAAQPPAAPKPQNLYDELQRVARDYVPTEQRVAQNQMTSQPQSNFVRPEGPAAGMPAANNMSWMEYLVGIPMNLEGREKSSNVTVLPAPKSGEPLPSVHTPAERRRLLSAEARRRATINGPPPLQLTGGPGVQSASPTPRKVQTVAIDPTTGGIAKPDLQGALERIAAEKRRLAGVTSPSLPTTLGDIPNPAGMTSPERMGNTTDTFQPSIADRLAQQKATLTKLPVDPRLAMAPGSMPAATPKVAQNPETVISPGGVPIYKPSLDKTEMPYTGPSLDELAGPPTASNSASWKNLIAKGNSVAPPPVKAASYPFNYPPQTSDPRLTAEPIPRPGTMPPVSADPGLVTYEVDPRTGKPRMVMAPGVVPQVAAMPPLPRPRPGAPTPPPVRFAESPVARQPAGKYGLPASEIPPYSLLPSPDAGIKLSWGRDAQKVASMNRGERPLLSALARLFSQQPSMPVASTMSVQPSGKGRNDPSYQTDAGRALLEWASGSGKSSMSS